MAAEPADGRPRDCALFFFFPFFPRGAELPTDGTRSRRGRRCRAEAGVPAPGSPRTGPSRGLFDGRRRPERSAPRRRPVPSYVPPNTAASQLPARRGSPRRSVEFDDGIFPADRRRRQPWRLFARRRAPPRAGPAPAQRQSCFAPRTGDCLDPGLRERGTKPARPKTGAAAGRSRAPDRSDRPRSVLAEDRGVPQTVLAFPPFFLARTESHAVPGPVDDPQRSSPSRSAPDGGLGEPSTLGEFLPSGMPGRESAWPPAVRCGVIGGLRSNDSLHLFPGTVSSPETSGVCRQRPTARRLALFNGKEQVLVTPG